MRNTRLTASLIVASLSAAAAPFAGCSSTSNGVTNPQADSSAEGGNDSQVVGESHVPGDAIAEDAGADPFDCSQDSAVEAPTHLRCTGLYQSWATKTLKTGVREFKPGVVLWSDGAEKKRWVYLPPGTKIDTTNMDQWQFPVGTKFWKEFSLANKRVETRLFWKIATTTWVWTTYQWSADEQTATRLDSGYNQNDAGDPEAGAYEIPTVAKCDQCHKGSEDKILGFEAVGLGLPGATGLTLAQLVQEGTLTTNPTSTALTIPEDGHGSANALGWLHANCGTACHNQNPTSMCNFKGMFLRLTYAELSSSPVTTDLDSYATTYNVAATIPSAAYMRIAPGNLNTSAIYYLASHRDNTNPNGQMPPSVSHIIDPTGVGYLSTWITQLP